MKASSIKPMGMELVLNNGASELTSATVPVRWFFTPEVLAKKPTHILVTIQNKTEQQEDRGRRFVYKVTDAIAYIPLLRPHWHRLTVYAFSDPQGMIAKQYLQRSSRTSYEHSISAKMVAKSAKFETEDHLIAYAEHGFRAPREFFVEAKRSGWVWKWANLWFDSDPVDQCEYRRRLIFAFSAKFFLWAGLVLLIGSWKLLSLSARAIGAVLKAVSAVLWYVIRVLYFTFGSLAHVFIGFRPMRLEDYLKREMRDKGDFFDLRLYTRRETYRVWSKDECECVITRSMPVTPLELLLFFGGAYWAYDRLMHIPHTSPLVADYWVYIGAEALCICIAGGVMITWMSRKLSFFGGKSVDDLLEKWSAAQRERKLAVANLRLERKQLPLIQRVFSLDRARDPVLVPDELDDPFDRAKLVFRVHYHTLKSQVCKPFTR